VHYSIRNLKLQFLRKNFILPTLLVVIYLLYVPDVFALEKRSIGWLEEVSINNEIKLKAKIDTGATTSSLNAKIIKKFQRDKQWWVQFRIANKDGEEIFLEKRIKRTVKIKRKLAVPLRRSVIMLGVCLGNVYRELEVNLANREKFDYRMLIGRNYLEDYFLVDSSRTFTTKPSCKI